MHLFLHPCKYTQRCSLRYSLLLALRMPDTRAHLSSCLAHPLARSAVAAIFTLWSQAGSVARVVDSIVTHTHSVRDNRGPLGVLMARCGRAGVGVLTCTDLHLCGAAASVLHLLPVDLALTETSRAVCVVSWLDSFRVLVCG